MLTTMIAEKKEKPKKTLPTLNSKSPSNHEIKNQIIALIPT